MDYNHQQGAGGTNGERELNPFRHVQPMPPADVDSEEFRQEMLQMQQRFAPQVSGSRARALELERELNSGTPAVLSTPARKSASHGQHTPRIPALRTVMIPVTTIDARAQLAGSLAADPLNMTERRLLSPEPASVALPLSPLSVETTRPLLLSSPSREATISERMKIATPQTGRIETVTSPSLTSGQITPPTRPTPPPTAPRRDRRTYPREVSRTPAASRVGIQPREAGAPRTAPPRPAVIYNNANRNGQRRVQATLTSQQRSSRRVSPTFIPPPMASTSTSPFMIDLHPTAGPSVEQTIQASYGLDTSLFGSVTFSPTPKNRSLTKISIEVPEQTPFPGMRTAHSIRDTLKRVSAETPKGSSGRSTPAESTVIRKVVPPSRLTEIHPEEYPESHMEYSAKITNDRNLGFREHRDSSPLGRMGSKASLKEDTKAMGFKSPEALEESLSQRPSQLAKIQKDNKDFGVDPKKNDTSGVPFASSSTEKSLEETLDSLRGLRNAIKRLEGTMKNYHFNMDLDAKELKRALKYQDATTKEELLKNQHHHAERVAELFQDLRRKEDRYRRNLDALCLQMITNPKPSAKYEEKGKTAPQSENKDEIIEVGEPQNLGRTSTPILPESGGEEEAEYERSVMTDPGMTPHLKTKLSQLQLGGKWGGKGGGYSNHFILP